MKAETALFIAKRIEIWLMAYGIFLVLKVVQVISPTVSMLIAYAILLWGMWPLLFNNTRGQNGTENN